MRALDGVDLRVARGALAAIIGPSGSGKTTIDAEEYARAMAAERRGLDAYRFERQEVALPWGGAFRVVVGDLPS